MSMSTMTSRSMRLRDPVSSLSDARISARAAHNSGIGKAGKISIIVGVVLFILLLLLVLLCHRNRIRNLAARLRTSKDKIILTPAEDGNSSSIAHDNKTTIDLATISHGSDRPVIAATSPPQIAVAIMPVIPEEQNMHGLQQHPTNNTNITETSSRASNQVSTPSPAPRTYHIDALVNNNEKSLQLPNATQTSEHTTLYHLAGQADRFTQDDIDSSGDIDLSTLTVVYTPSIYHTHSGADDAPGSVPRAVVVEPPSLEQVYSAATLAPSYSSAAHLLQPPRTTPMPGLATPHRAANESGLLCEDASTCKNVGKSESTVVYTPSIYHHSENGGVPESVPRHVQIEPPSLAQGYSTAAFPPWAYLADEEGEFPVHLLERDQAQHGNGGVP